MIILGPLNEDRFAEAAQVIDTDRIIGQPCCTPARVARVARGEAMADQWYWSRLERIDLRSAFDSDGRLLGCGSRGVAADGTRYLIWLHGRENPTVVRALVDELVPTVEGNVFAFWFATDLTIGFEGLPVSTRPVTHSALVSAGFEGTNAWLYLHTTDPGDPPDPALSCTVCMTERGRMCTYVTEVDGAQVATVEAAVDDGVGVLWWMQVTPAWRRKGVGRALLRTLRRDLWRRGADQMVLYVDHDDPEERDRRPALRLYQAEGFKVVERPLSYKFPHAVEDQGDDPPA
jgi:ribosomal protein S18 acetylase RimI-like enzyme